MASLAAAVIGGFALTGPVSGPGGLGGHRGRPPAPDGAQRGQRQGPRGQGQGRNIEAIAVNAETLALNARHIPALFPKGSMTDKSYAKAEIWDKWAEFEAAAKNLEEKAIALRDAARRRTPPRCRPCCRTSAARPAAPATPRSAAPRTSPSAPDPHGRGG